VLEVGSRSAGEFQSARGAGVAEPGLQHVVERDVGPVDVDGVCLAVGIPLTVGMK